MMEDEFNWCASVDLSELNNCGLLDETDMINRCENSDSELLNMLGLEKLSQDSKSSFYFQQEQEQLLTETETSGDACLNQLDLQSEYRYFAEDPSETPELLQEPVPVAVPLPVFNLMTTTNVSDENSTHQKNKYSASARPKVRGHERKRTAASAAIDDHTLATMSVTDLRHSAPREDLDNLSKRRRRLKNRQYARTSRIKRMREKDESEKSKQSMEKELKTVKAELRRTQQDLAAMTVDRNLWQTKWKNLRDEMQVLSRSFIKAE